MTLGSIPGLIQEVTGLLATDVLGRKNQKVGMPPGSPTYTGKQEVETVRISVIDYDGENLREETVALPAASQPYGPFAQGRQLSDSGHRSTPRGAPSDGRLRWEASQRPTRLGPP